LTVEATRPFLLIYAPAAHAEHASMLGDGLAFKFTEQTGGFRTSLSEPSSLFLSTILTYRIEILSTTFSLFSVRKKVERMASVATPTRTPSDRG
jgi:hypothetical protein